MISSSRNSPSILSLWLFRHDVQVKLQVRNWKCIRKIQSQHSSDYYYHFNYSRGVLQSHESTLRKK